MDESSFVPLDFGDSTAPLSPFESKTFEPDNHVNPTALSLDGATASLLREIQSVSQSYTATATYDSPQEAICVLSHLCSIIERLLVLTRTPPATPEGLEKQSFPAALVPHLAQSCRFAAAIHVLTPLSGYFPNPFLIITSLIRDLKRALTPVLAEGLSVPEPQQEAQYTELLVWLLAVGGVSAHSMPERGWFVAHLQALVPRLEMSEWLHFQQTLKSFTFHDLMCDRSYSILWREVMNEQPLSLGLYPGENDGRPHPCRTLLGKLGTVS